MIDNDKFHQDLEELMEVKKNVESLLVKNVSSNNITLYNSINGEFSIKFVLQKTLLVEFDDKSTVRFHSSIAMPYLKKEYGEIMAAFENIILEYS